MERLAISWEGGGKEGIEKERQERDLLFLLLFCRTYLSSQIASSQQQWRNGIFLLLLLLFPLDGVELGTFEAPRGGTNIISRPRPNNVHKRTLDPISDFDSERRKRESFKREKEENVLLLSPS